MRAEDDATRSVGPHGASRAAAGGLYDRRSSTMRAA